MVMVNGKVLPMDDWHRKYYWDLRKNAWNCAPCSITLTKPKKALDPNNVANPTRLIDLDSAG